MLFEPHENVIDIPVGDTTKAAAGGGEKKPFYFQILMKKYPWSHWVFAYFVGIIYFLSFRLESITILLKEYGSTQQKSDGTSTRSILLGILQDFVLISYAVTLLHLFDSRYNKKKTSMDSNKTLKIWLRLGRFFVYLILFIALMAPFCADSVLIRTRLMRFTFDYIKMYLNDKNTASALDITHREITIIQISLISTCLTAFAFALIACFLLDFSLWSPLKSILQKWKNHHKERYIANIYQSESAIEEKKTKIKFSTTKQNTILNHWYIKLIGFAFQIVLTFITYGISTNVDPVVSMIALNASLNEIWRIPFGLEFIPKSHNDKDDDDFKGGDSEVYTDSTNDDFDVDFFIDRNTETYRRFGKKSLYRKTLGFKGELEFNVTVDSADPPNVLLFVIESFRYHDSQYLAGNNTYLFKEQNMTITPNFDKWAKRGIAFRNLWSSWRTSRSVESILFGQVAYDSATETGTTGGRRNVQLAGMPQFFKEKGYDTSYISGCRADYDQWDKFFPSHGYDFFWEKADVKARGTEWFNIDWEIGRRSMGWGVHDDVAADVIAKYLIDRKEEQMKDPSTKKPLFLTTYTISSHTPFTHRPDWYLNDPSIPDFSALYNGETYSNDVKNYLEMRYFQDMALGNLMDKLNSSGVLNDSIVIIVGDHGQAPEFGLDIPEQRRVSAHRVGAALIAEGRLGKHAGMMYEDAAHQNDLLNTLADIVGVPETGFIQSGVGRSLKRKIQFGKRVVFANNPALKLAVIQAHLRVEFDKVTDVIRVYDVEKDVEQKDDLYATLADDPEKKKEFERMRDAGRWINKYFKIRWDGACILSPTC